MAHNNLGVAYEQQDQLEEAIAEWQEAIRLDPDYTMPHYNLGLVYYAQGKLEEAIAEWQEAIRLDPDYASAHKNMGIAYRELGMADEAVAELQAYLELRPDGSDRAQIEAIIAELSATTAKELPPDNSIKFENSLTANDENVVLFLALPGDKVIASFTPASGSDILVEVQDSDQNALAIVNESSGEERIAYTVPEGRNLDLYRIVVRSAAGSGSYKALLIGSADVAFDLDPLYLVNGRVPAGGSLLYSYTELKPGLTLNLLVVPNPDKPIDPLIRISSLTSVNNILLEVNETGPGEEERMVFPIPEVGTYIIWVGDAAGNSGEYMLAVKSE